MVCARITTADEPTGRREEDLSRRGRGAAPAVAVEDLFAELVAGPLRDVRVEMLHGQLPERGEGAP